MHPIVIVLLDGLADRAHDSLGGRTANEVADTPNLPAPAAPLALGVPGADKQITDARELAKQNPAAVAHIVRGWVGKETS